MVRVVSELIVSLDGCARGTRSPGYYGYSGPEFDAWLQTNNAEPHRKLMGRKTYELLNSLPAQARDDAWQRMSQAPGYLFSKQLKSSEWPGLQLVSSDVVEFIEALKDDEGPELRVVGSLSIMRQLAQAKLLDLLRLTICPLILPETGTEHFFESMSDLQFELAAHRVLDDRVMLLDYRPAGPPPRTN